MALQIGGDRNVADTALRTPIERDAKLYAYVIAQVYALARRSAWSVKQ